MKYELITINKTDLMQFEKIKAEFDITSIVVENSDQYVNLAELLKKVKGKIKEVQDFFKEPKAQAYKNHREIAAMEKEYLEHLNNFENLAKKAISEFRGENELVPKVKGISTMTKWRWEVIDIDQVPKAIGNIQLWKLDEKAINELITMTNGSLPIPGLKIYEEKVVSVRSDD